MTSSMRYVSAIALSAALLLSIGGCGNAPGGGESETITLKGTWTVAETSTGAAGAKAFAEYLEEKSDGRITFEHYWSGALANATDSIKAVRSGVADVSFVSTVVDPGSLPITNWSAPLTAVVPPVAAQRVIGSQAMTELFATNEALIDEYAKQDLTVLGTTSTTNMWLACTKPVTTLAEAKGLRAPAVGPLWEPEYKALGMTLVSLNTGADQYEGLQRGVIDCAAFPPLSLYDLGLLDVAPHVIATPILSTGGQVIFNSGVLDSMSEADQELIRDAAHQFLAEYAKANLVRAAEVFGPDGEAYEKGIEVHLAPELDQVLKDQQIETMDAMSTNLPSGLTQSEAAALIEQFRAYASTAEARASGAGFDLVVPATVENLQDSLGSAGNPELTRAFYGDSTG